MGRPFSEPPKGDVTDWRDAGGRLDRFRELVAAAEPLDARALSALRARWSITNEEPKRQAARVEVTDDWRQEHESTRGLLHGGSHSAILKHSQR